MDNDNGDIDQLIDEFHAESDRGCAVLVMCALEDDLLGAIARRLPECNKDMIRNIAPLGRLSSTLNNAYLLGVVSASERDEFEILIKVRNKFAHDALRRLAFDHHDVRHLCEKLRICDAFEEYPARTPRARYVTSSVLMMLMLRQAVINGVGNLELKGDAQFNLQ